MSPRRTDPADRVLALLSEGPLPTLTLAARVLGLRGPAGPAAQAVWALLGDDRRFSVSADGVWSLRPDPAALLSLREHDWVVVDVETTGGNPGFGHRVTEIAAVWVSGHQLRDEWSTLVNPERPIPPEITSLTGITDTMVRGAPRWAEVAEQVRARLGDRVFVAHNAPFDSRFVHAEMERVMPWSLAGRQLCTVRLSRKLLAHLPSRSLGALVQHFRIDSGTRHRALADATATAQVLLRLLDQAAEAGVTCWADLEMLLRRRSPRRRRRAAPINPGSASSGADPA